MGIDYRSLAEGLCCRELAETLRQRALLAAEGARPTYERNEGPILHLCFWRTHNRGLAFVEKPVLYRIL